MEDSEIILRSTNNHRVLNLRTRIAYSFGHVLNDLCSSMWFTYLLLYQHFVLQFQNRIAGFLLLVGQIADAIATPFVGIESDRQDNFWCCKYGRKKTWHLLGTVSVLVSFPFLFLQCIGCNNAHQTAQFVYYAAFIIIFQFGWAAVQISHLSLITDLTPISSERVELNAYRYAATVASNILVYLITWLALGMNGEGKNNLISPHDAPEFLYVALSVVAIGIVFSVMFHIGVKEPPRLLAVSIQEESINTKCSIESHFHLKWKDWFKEIQFYQIGVLYMATRLYNNLSQVYITLYLQDSLQLKRESIAIIPLVIYVSGFISSFFMKVLSSKAGKKPIYFVGCVLALTASIWLYFGSGNKFRYGEIYGLSVLIGSAGSTMLIISLSITSDLIGHHTTSGAFVFGAMSFLDKLANGIAVIVIQDLHPCITCCSDCKWYYRNVLVFACGGAVIIALISLLTLVPVKIGVKTERKGLIKNNRIEEIDKWAGKENGESSHSSSIINDNSPLIFDSNEVGKTCQNV